MVAVPSGCTVTAAAAIPGASPEMRTLQPPANAASSAKASKVAQRQCSLGMF